MPIGRRRLLWGALAALASPAWGREAPRVLGGAWREAPDFTRLQQTLVGVRPHRVGGVRLEREQVGDRRIVHDYGHGGAGITLAWGCAREVVERLAPDDDGQPVAVLGAGIVGLTAAMEILRRWPGRAVTLYAKDHRLQSTTSWLAAGQFEPSGIWHEHDSVDGRARLAGWLRGSLERIRSMDGPSYGVAPRDQFTLDRPQPALDEVTPVDVVAPYEAGLLPFEHLNGPGRRYQTWLVDPRRHLPALKRELEERGARLVERTFATRADVMHLSERTIVNCTGYGARRLWDDEAMVPQRGHLLLLERTAARQDWFFAGGCGNLVPAYVFCRHDDIVVGGTVIAGDDEPATRPSDEVVFDRLLANGASLFGGRVDRCR